MRALLSTSVLASALAVASVFASVDARADDLAPELERAELRAEAHDEVARQLDALPANDRKRLVGTYAVIDSNASDPFAQVACDDDGDHVVVLSEAMLDLVVHVARAIQFDEAAGSRKVDDYAALLARSQRSGRRLLLPPPGFYDARETSAQASTNFDGRFHEVLAFVVGAEIARLRAADLACPKPTATKESGDDVWTEDERRKASAIAVRTYPAHQAEGDDAALAAVIERGGSDKGVVGLLHFFARFETEARSAGSRFVPGYVTLHPDAATRSSDLAKSAALRRAAAESKDDSRRVR